MQRISIQPDWDSLNQKTLSLDFWVQYKNSTEPSINENLSILNTELSSCTSHQKEQTNRSHFFIKNISNDKKSINIFFKDESAFFNGRFIAATQKFALHLNKKNQKQPVYNIDVTSGGLGVSCSTDGSMLIWLTENGQIRRHLEGHISDINVCKFFPSGLVVLSGGSDLRAKVWSAEDGSCPVTLVGHTSGLSDLCIVDKGRNVVTVSRDGTCKLWDVGQSKCIAKISKFDSIINSCSIQSSSMINLPQSDQITNEREIGTENKMISCACEDGYLRIVGLKSRQTIAEFNCHYAINCCCFLSDTIVACGTQNGSINLFDLRNNKENLDSWKEFRSAILSIQNFPLNSGFLATTADGSCFSSNLNDKSKIVDFTGPDCDPVYKAAFNDSNLFTCCRDGFIRKYNLSHIFDQ